MMNNESTAAGSKGGLAHSTSLSSFKVYPLGFSAFEKSTIETFFRLAARRAPFWSVTPRVEDATVVLISAESRQDFDAHTRRMSPVQKGLIVGSSDFGSGWSVIARPLKLTALLTSLSIYGQSESTKVEPVAVSVAPPPESRANRLDQNSGYSSGFVPLHAAPVVADSSSSFSPISPVPAVPPILRAPVAPAPRPVLRPSLPPAAKPFERAVELSTSTFGSHSTQRSSAMSAVIAARNVLIVDDSDVALKFMQSRLRHFGYESKLARSGEEALTMTEQEDFQFVFLDVMMAGLDGYQTCRAIKQNKGKRATIPVVVMLTSRGGTIDKIRGSMSGCDAYLTKPLNEQQLGMVLAQHAATSIKKAASTDPVALATTGASVAAYVSRAPGRVTQPGRP